MYLNVDLGEEIKPNLEIEKAVMPYIDACNIACGGHAGNKVIMEESIYLAKKYDVKIGAHPSYPDKHNFGRESMIISDDILLESFFYQIYLLQKLADQQGVKVNHIKMHGALYNDSAKDKTLATLLVKAIKTLDQDYILFAPPKSILSAVATEYDIEVHYEIFGDRNYNDDLSLMNRKYKKALITDKLELSVHLKSILHEQNIKSISGKVIGTKMDTICMHSDHDHAIENIELVSNWIRRNKVS